MNEMGWLVIISLLVLGLCFGSFINALVWRLHEKRDFVSERSECVHCHHVLAWFDLVPVLSWLQLRGKCRYCHKPISAQYPIVESLTAITFIISYLIWPFGWSTVGMLVFGLWLVTVVLLIALAVYDLHWMLLPDKLTFPLIAVAAVSGLLLAFGVFKLPLSEGILFLLGGIASLAGVYYVLYAVSSGRWVGFGDVKLGIALGLLGGWKIGLLTLFLANLIGLLIMIPGMIAKRITRTSRVPFGPFLIAGFVISYLASQPIIDGYFQMVSWAVSKLLML